MQNDPATRVSAPAIGLIVAGGLSAAFTVFGMLALAVGGAAAFADKQTADALPGIGILLGVGIIKLALDALTMFAGFQMRRMRSWGLSLAGAIIAMLPCSVCCLLGLPMGIWAVIVLVDTDVKRSFSA